MLEDIFVEMAGEVGCDDFGRIVRQIMRLLKKLC